MRAISMLSFVRHCKILQLERQAAKDVAAWRKRQWNCVAGGTYTPKSLKAGESHEQRHGSKEADEEEAGEDLRGEARCEAREAAD
jgi:hypothetical protein